MKVCECGHALAVNANFCDACGRPQQPAADIAGHPGVSLAKSAPGFAPHSPGASPREPDGTPESAVRRRRRVGIAVLAVVAVVLVAFGGIAAWKATAVRRTCVLQPDEVAAVAGWQPTFSSATSGGGGGHPNVRCTYIDDTSGGSASFSKDRVTTLTASTEDDATPTGVRRCLKGGFWGGRGYACQTATDITGGDVQLKTARVSLTGVRLNGDASYGVDIDCVEQIAPEGTVVRQQLREQCLRTLSRVMDALTDRLDTPADVSVPQQPLRVEDLSFAAAGGTSGGG